MITSFMTALMVSVTALLLLAMWLNVPALIFKQYGNFSWVGLLYLINSVITFILYAYDKTEAGQNKIRVPEALLHVSEALGGWPGGLIARPVLHHKTNWQKKTGFKIINWLIIFVHLGFWLWVFFIK